MKSRLQLTAISATLLSLVGSVGCAHYHFPVTSMNAPETRGATGLNQVEVLGVHGGHDLITHSSSFSPSVGITAGLSEKVDVGVRFLARGPLSGLFQYQFAGTSLKQRGSERFIASFVARPGFLLGKYSDETVTYFTSDFSIVSGYRITPSHVVTLSPFASIASLSGVDVSGSQYGARLGYQYAVENMMIRTELAYHQGKLADTEIGGFSVFKPSIGIMLVLFAD